MPKSRLQRTLDLRNRATVVATTSGGGGSVSVVVDHGALLGLADDDHTQYHTDARGDARYIPNTRQVIAGAGLTGGGALTDDRTFDVGAGDGITVAADSVALASSVAGAGLTYSSGVVAVGAGSGLTVNADDVALTTPGTLTVSSANSAAGSHTHAVTASSDVSAGVAALLKSSAAGALTLATLNTTTNVNTPLVNTSSGALTLDAAGDIVSIGASNSLRSSHYASQTTGWGISYAGGGDFRYVFADELHARAFIADLEQALAGGQVISKSVALLAYDFVAPAVGGTGTLYVRDLPSAPGMTVFVANDTVRLRAFTRSGGSLSVADCWGVVTSASIDTGPGGSEVGVQRWTFTRGGSGLSGSMSPGYTVKADALVLDYGTAGNGIYEVTATDGVWAENAPYMQIATWASHPSTMTPRVRVGNLKGITAASEYGLWAGSTTGGNVKVTGDAVQLRQGSTTVISLNADGSSRFDAAMTFGTDGGFYQGTGTFASPTTGLKLWRDSGIGRIGGYNGGALQWYGSTDGKLYFGDGGGRLDRDGITVQAGTGMGWGAQWYRFEYTGASRGGMGYAMEPTANRLRLHSLGENTRRAEIDIWAQAISAGDSRIYLRAGLDGGSQAEIAIESTTAPGIRLYAPGAGTFDLDGYANEIDLFGPGVPFNIDCSSVNISSSVTLTSATPTLNVGSSAVSTGTCNIEIGTGRTGDGLAHVDLIGDTTYTNYGFRVARQSGANGATQMLHRGTGNVQIRTNEAAAILLETNNTTRLTVASTGGVTAAVSLESPTVNATTGFQRSGTTGTIYVPVTPLEMTDGTNTWGGAFSAATNTYTFDVNDAGNGSLPAATKAVRILFSGSWASALQTRNAIVKKGGAVNSDATIFLRSSANGISADTQGVVEVDSNGQFQIVVSGATMDNALVRLVGYYI